MPAFNPALLGYPLYRSGLVPRLIPAMGLIGAPLLASSTLGMRLGVNERGSVWEVVGTAPILFWELSLRLWMTFKGFNPSALSWPRLLLSGGVRPPHEKDRQRCRLRPARRSPMPPTCPRTLEIGRRWPSLAVDSEAGSSTGRLQSSATISHWTRS